MQMIDSIVIDRKCAASAIQGELASGDAICNTSNDGTPGNFTPAIFLAESRGMLRGIRPKSLKHVSL